jgi:hypothetical protein
MIGRTKRMGWLRLATVTMATVTMALVTMAMATLGAAAAAEPKTLLLVSQSPDSHPRGTHEYKAGVELLARLLEPNRELKIRLANGDEPWTEGPELLAQADGVVIFVSEGARWLQAAPRRYEAFERLRARGGGLVALHWAMGTRLPEPIEPYLKLFGGCHGGADRKYQVVDTLLHVADREHPIAKGLEDVCVHDEFYYQLKFVKAAAPIVPVLEATIDGQAETVAWSWERPDGGRSFGFSGLHFHENWQLSEYRRLLTQAVLWTLKLPPI